MRAALHRLITAGIAVAVAGLIRGLEALGVENPIEVCLTAAVIATLLTWAVAS